MLCFDDIELADSYTHKTIRMVLKYFSKVYIVCLLRDEYLNKSCFTNPNMPSQEKLYSDSFQKIASEDILVNDQSYKEIELKPLKMKELY